MVKPPAPLIGLEICRPSPLFVTVAVVLEPRTTGAVMKCVPPESLIAAEPEGLERVIAPLLPWLIVYDLVLLKLIVPTDQLPLRLMVEAAVMELVKFAVSPAVCGGAPLQSPSVLQLPPLAMPQVPTVC